MLTLEDLLVYKPSTFDGEPNPPKVRNWLSEIENACEGRLSDENDWIIFGKQFMTGMALKWYNYLWNPKHEKRSWKEFSEALKGYFAPPGYTNIMDRAFEKIQCTYTVAEYSILFLELKEESSLDWDNNPEYLKHHYLQGLPAQIKMLIFPRPERTLDELMRAAQNAEDSLAMNDHGLSRYYLQEFTDSLGLKMIPHYPPTNRGVYEDHRESHHNQRSKHSKANNRGIPGNRKSQRQMSKSDHMDSKQSNFRLSNWA